MIFILNVPFEERNQVKALGARWYSDERKWVYKGDVLPEGLKRWYDDPQDSDNQITGGEELPINNFDPYANYQTVSQVNNMISRIFNGTTQFYNILVKGEVTNFRKETRRDHYYFSLKEIVRKEINGRIEEEKILLPCIMWESTANRILNFELDQGQQVAVKGTLKFYDKGGQTQFIVTEIHNIGAGLSNLAYLELKNRLQAEGLFNEEYKKPIPKHIETIGVLAAKKGQAILDVCSNVREMNPYVQMYLFSVNVQGKNAVNTILEGIRTLDDMNLDVIILTRGGGSDEELSVFNDERVVRAVFNARTPMVSAIGHEGNKPLVDSVADLEVNAPTKAALKIIPDIMKQMKTVDERRRNIANLMAMIVKNRRLLVETKLARLNQNSPQTRFKENSEKLKHLQEMLVMNIKNVYRIRSERFQYLDENIIVNMNQKFSRYKEKSEILVEKLNSNMTQNFEKRKHRLEVLLTKLNVLSPTATLVRGFGYISKDDKPVTSVDEVKQGEGIRVRLHDGSIDAKVTEVVKETLATE